MGCLVLFILITDKNNSWQRVRYGRLSVDSDDQICNKNNNDLLIENDIENLTCYHKNHNNLDNRTTHNLDDNGNDKENLNENGNFHDIQPDFELDNRPKIDRINSKSTNQKIDHNTINRLHAMAISDDDDYGEFLFLFFILQSPIQFQILALS